MVFVSFATKDLSPTLQRIRKEATDSRFFNEIKTFDEDSFDYSYRNKYTEWYEHNPRGYGYWIWKPYIILRELEKMEDGDILTYLDAGCSIHRSGEPRYLQYLEMLSAENPIICFDHINCYVHQYTKADVLEFFGLRHETAFTQSKQYMAGLLLIYKCPRSIQFIREWYDLCHKNGHLVNDEPSLLPERDSFIQHRHDQSVFTCLCWKYGIKALSQIEVYPQGGDWSTMSSYPFWASRNKQSKKPSLLLRIIRKIHSMV